MDGCGDSGRQGKTARHVNCGTAKLILTFPGSCQGEGRVCPAHARGAMPCLLSRCLANPSGNASESQPTPRTRSDYQIPASAQSDTTDQKSWALPSDDDGYEKDPRILRNCSRAKIGDKERVIVNHKSGLERNLPVAVWVGSRAGRNARFIGYGGAR
ncbi:hypothetical protein Bbelb_446370 [Branchiostoma belcheri]|nr:hypothetical protein Bbelb_446370 [Branchiostoma belcheri]